MVYTKGVLSSTRMQWIMLMLDLKNLDAFPSLRKMNVLSDSMLCRLTRVELTCASDIDPDLYPTSRYYGQPSLSVLLLVRRFANIYKESIDAILIPTLSKHGLVLATADGFHELASATLLRANGDLLAKHHSLPIELHRSQGIPSQGQVSNPASEKRQWKCFSCEKHVK